MTDVPKLVDFASDNVAGAHPDVLAAIAAANTGAAASYGADDVTARLAELVTWTFGPAATGFPVLTGTGANIVALHSMVGRWESVVTPVNSHINTDECGAAEIGGLKLITSRSAHGKLTPADIERAAAEIENRHRSHPGAVSISQSTELGTSYSASELTALAATAHAAGLSVHMDGARLANAAAHLGTSLAALTTDVGIDLVSFGCTKNGAMAADLIVVLNQDAAHGLPSIQKADTQLSSKMRFVSAQIVALLENDLWLANARRANRLASRLAAGLAAIEGTTIMAPVQSNAVFARFAREVEARLLSRYALHIWDADLRVLRIMTSFDMTDATVDELLAVAHGS
ncbi:threonine aldolase family protein [Microbacterium sp. ASV49]|uniref:Beta-eliminating lyase-related protein n=1 Tax=Microbacterium candidum TaxID=3041922 RepID=A0ABT7MW38_9MICO|nr:beta-eliminating lyase-related protein [Microbacterium sp. ASV49]MDL9978669.1 beta-eliminating lyase-related protein [Microbacterium sp. ASV49]